MRASPAAQFIREQRLLADAATQLTSALGAERFAALAAQARSSTWLSFSRSWVIGELRRRSSLGLGRGCISEYALK